MKGIAIGLFVFQGISLVGSVINGTISRNLEDLMFMNGLYGYGRLLGYFLPAIIGAFCLHIHKKNCLKEKASDAEKPRTSPAAEAPQPARMPQPAADAGAVRVETKHPTMDLQSIMTSQLVYLWMQTGNADYLAEYKRRLKMCGLNEETIRLEWKQKGAEDTYFNAYQLSDGTLRFICLATLLLQPELPQTIIIDEPELGLHPQAINRLATLIKKASAKSQVIISTQSVNLVDNFDVNNIIAVDMKDHASCFRRLNKEKLSVWLDEYSTGELWEKNLIGGQL